jgi:hypothetical protein
MKSIGEIAYLILTKCSKAEIANSLCYCVGHLYKKEIISAEEASRFGDVITGWQAVGQEDKELDSYILEPDGTHYGRKIREIHGVAVTNSYSVFLPVEFKEKRQWLVNLAIMHMRDN